VNITRRPEWLKVRLRNGRVSKQVRDLVNSYNLHTVCQSARCPNIAECWANRTATFMILGNVCTRNCRFCAVVSGKPSRVDLGEPERVARAVQKLNLNHAVITSVTRDDLEDGGSELFVKTVLQIRNIHPNCSVEILIPDFKGNEEALVKVFEVQPDILDHNLEVIPRLYPKVRQQANFKTSLGILKLSKEKKLVTKTGIMIGLGESLDEIKELIDILAEVKIDILTIGQYLQPSRCHVPVQKFYHPNEFAMLKLFAEQHGIGLVESGPLVRSSYHAAEQKKNLSKSLAS
jgi:lipoic acid synthetase